MSFRNTNTHATVNTHTEFLYTTTTQQRMSKKNYENGGTLLLLFALNETNLSNFLYILRRLAISKC